MAESWSNVVDTLRRASTFMTNMQAGGFDCADDLKIINDTLANAVVMAAGSDESPRNVTIREMARNGYQQDGEVEVDDIAMVSEGGDNGAYVQAWVWVSFGDSEFDTEKEEEPDDQPCTDLGGHSFVETGTAYGGDDERFHGEGRSLCEYCGADGDA